MGLERQDVRHHHRPRRTGRPRLVSEPVPLARLHWHVARYDPAKHALVTLEQFRETFAMAVARYHTADHTALLNRKPLEVWLEQRELHGLAWVRDPDHFRRAVGEVDYVTFRSDGFGVEGLRYGCDGSDERFPISNDEILFHLGMARGVSSDTAKRSFDNVKIKYDPNDLSVAYLFDEHLRRYVELPCTMRRYAENLPLWLHDRLREYAREKRLQFEAEHDMVAVREAYAREMAKIVPEATAAERRAAARLADSSQGRAYLGDAVKLVKVKPSPSGMESIVEQDDRVGTRGDATRVAPRSSTRTDKEKGLRDRRDAPKSRKPDNAGSTGQDAVRSGRRLDVDLSSDGYM